jgi:hypothetical protein
MKSQWDRFDRGSRAGIASAPSISIRLGVAQFPRRDFREWTPIKRRERPLESFSSDQWLCCSLLSASAHVWALAAIW